MTKYKSEDFRKWLNNFIANNNDYFKDERGNIFKKKEGWREGNKVRREYVVDYRFMNGIEVEWEENLEGRVGFGVSELGQELLEKWKSEVDQREREENNMEDKILKEWLAEDETRKKGLPRWDLFDFYNSWQEEWVGQKTFDLSFDWELEWGDFESYWEVAKQFEKEKSGEGCVKHMEMFFEAGIKKTISLKTQIWDKESQIAVLLLAQATASQQEKEINQKKIEGLEKEIQDLITLKTRLGTENDTLKGKISELETKLNEERREIDKLRSDYQTLLQELENLTESAELSIPANPENQTVSNKISFFNNWLKKNKKEKEELAETIQKEQQEGQQIRNSLNSLEEQIKNSDNINLQKLQQLQQNNDQLREKIKKIEGNLSQKDKEVQKLKGENSSKLSEINALKDQLKNTQAELDKNNQKRGWKNYGVLGIVVVVILLAGVLAYKWIRKYYG